MEHRWGLRVGVDLPVRIKAPGGICGDGLIRNISASGAFVETLLPLALLTRVVVVPSDPDEGSESASVPGHVVRTSDEGVGLEWCELATSALRLESIGRQRARRGRADVYWWMAPSETVVTHE
ncbi:MAG TPA: PilZ domain-containing protein [Steroidobacteraceae bacterium]|nr:PilZ domain-containing protein [Steroidobacteraceae bacterium]